MELCRSSNCAVNLSAAPRPQVAACVSHLWTPWLASESPIDIGMTRVILGT